MSSSAVEGRKKAEKRDFAILLSDRSLAEGFKKSCKKSEKKLRKNLQVIKKSVPLQSLSETGVRQEPQGTLKNPYERLKISSLKRLRGRNLRGSKRRESERLKGVQEQVPKTK